MGKGARQDNDGVLKDISCFGDICPLDTVQGIMMVFLGEPVLMSSEYPWQGVGDPCGGV